MYCCTYNNHRRSREDLERGWARDYVLLYVQQKGSLGGHRIEKQILHYVLLYVQQKGSLAGYRIEKQILHYVLLYVQQIVNGDY